MRRFQRIARALYMPTLGMAGIMPDGAVVRLYASMCAPTSQLAAEVFAAWQKLPEAERTEACERMRIQLARMAPRGRRR